MSTKHGVIEEEAPSFSHNEVKAHAGGKDEAERAQELAESHAGMTWSEAEEKKLRLKLDLMIVPLTFVSGLFCYADSGAYGVAALFGLIRDLELYEIVSFAPLVIDTNKYSWTSSIPTFGNIVTTIPILLLAQRVPLGKLYSSLVVWSGLFGLLMLVVHDFGGTMAVRIFYGVQGILPSVLLIYISSWYKQAEQPLRLGLISTGSALGGLVGQGIDFAAINIGGRYASQPWRWMYVIIGACALLLGLINMAFLPDTPTKAFFLSPREKAIAIERVRKNGTGMQTSAYNIKEGLRALQDPQIYALAYCAFVINFGNSALGSFGALLAGSFGYSAKETLQLVMPSSGIAFVVILGSGMIPTFFKNARIWVGVSGLLITIAGNVILWRSPRSSQSALLGGLYISVFFFSAFVAVISLTASNIGGSTKKTTANAVIFIMSSIGGIAAPFSYKGEESAQGYPTGIITTLVLQCIAVLVLLALRFHYVRYNKKADERNPIPEDETVIHADVIGFGDQSEQEVGYFRYQY